MNTHDNRIDTYEDDYMHWAWAMRPSDFLVADNLFFRQL